mmetsp:Transcript_2076/g.1394  ORF Transcript_2076/g.1394 Transcript_2076/m.1394 type:complete len:86 (-) Transcript_2076:279-536(-)
MITRAAGEKVNDVLFGTVINEELEDDLQVTVFATGFPKEAARTSMGSAKDYELSLNRSGFSEKRNMGTGYGNVDAPAWFRRNKLQ